MEITPNLHVIANRIVNCFLIVEESGLTLIDTGLPSFYPLIKETVESTGNQIGDIKHIFLTHSDGDHVGTLAQLKKETRATTYASKIEAQAIRQGKASREVEFGVLGKLLKPLMARFMTYEPVEIDVVLENAEVLPIFGELQVVPSEGHTPGHISFFSPPNRVLFAGDSMRAKRDKLIESKGGNTWDEKKALNSALLQAFLKPEIVCVGHGPVIKNAVKKFPTGN